MAVEALRVRVLRGHVRAAGWVVPPGCCFAGITWNGPRLLQGGWARDRRYKQKKKKADDTGSASAPGSGSSSEVGSDDGSATEALTSNYDADDEGDNASAAIRDFLSLHRDAAAVKKGDRVLGLWTEGATDGSEEWYPGNATKVDETLQQSVEVTFIRS